MRCDQRPLSSRVCAPRAAPALCAMSSIDYTLTLSLAAALLWSAWHEFRRHNRRDGWLLAGLSATTGIGIGAATVIF